jgi:hypothetical protein
MHSEGQNDQRSLSHNDCVSVMLIGLVKVVEGRIGGSRVDRCAALASLLFLVSAFASYISIRHTGRPQLSDDVK